jgi:hypothetical protein
LVDTLQSFYVVYHFLVDLLTQYEIYFIIVRVADRRHERFVMGRREDEAREKAAAIEEEQRRKGNHERADNVARTSRETIEAIRREEEEGN